MKTENNILVAFILNLGFSIFEFVGGILTGSVAISSDALHDIGDAASIGISYFLERKSKRKADDNYTYGYARYSVIGGAATALILACGSVMIVVNSIERILNPVEINYNGMLIFAVIGTLINLLAAFFTRGGETLNQRAVNLHMLEDVLGWIVVLLGALVMKFTNFSLLDPIMSLGVSVFIFINAIKTLKEALSLFLEKTPAGMSIEEIKEHILEIEDIADVHHIHIWSVDGSRAAATMHIVTSGEPMKIKKAVRAELSEHGIDHATLELETENEKCEEKNCAPAAHTHCHHHHHH